MRSGSVAAFRGVGEKEVAARESVACRAGRTGESTPPARRGSSSSSSTREVTM